MWNDEVIYDNSIIDCLPLEITQDKEFMEELTEIHKAKKRIEKAKKHDVSEISDAISDRKVQDIDKIMSEIEKEMKNKPKDNEQTKE